MIANTIAWMSNNVEGSYKRSVALGMIISLYVTRLFVRTT
jgi:hypothetical protein